MSKLAFVMACNSVELVKLRLNEVRAEMDPVLFARHMQHLDDLILDCDRHAFSKPQPQPQLKENHEI